MRKLLKSALNSDYRIIGYYKKDEDTFLTDAPNSAFDEKGDLVKVQYFQDYDEVTKSFLKKRIEENRVYERNAIGLLTKRTIEHKWFDEFENEIGNKTTIKVYSSAKAYSLQKRASEVLINRASIYLIGAIATNNSGDYALAMQKAKQFLEEVSTEKSLYIDQNKELLLTAITNTTNADITQDIKNTLIQILNINYLTL